MYETHWNLNARPFENRAQDAFYYPAETHQAAVLKLRYAIENRRACAMLCGPSGIGKSLLVEAIDRQLSPEFTPFCHVVFPTLNSEQLIRYVVDYVCPESGDPRSETANDLVRFESFLHENMEKGRHAVVVIDEAHLLENANLLEPLRLLLNIGATQSPGEAAWTLVLVGQPTLLSQVERNLALDERLSVKCMLNRFLPDETASYIQHRLIAAGATAERIFNAEAIERIHQVTEGVPRRINRLCDLALMVGFAEDQDSISAEIIDNVHNDLASPRAA
ncbi:MAG: AAA family ATPase [Planctomycetota bacterium]